jgi:hypothetical protein
LVQIRSKRLDFVYLQPGADLRGYTKVIVEPTEVAFRKDWRRDYNRGSRQLSGRVSDSDVQEAISKGVAAASDIITEAWRSGGYGISDAPGPDVLRVTTGIVNISVSAPEQGGVRTRSYAHEAGEALLFVEVRDSMTGALLGRAVDRGIAGDNTVGWRSRVSNRADFRQMVERWARIMVTGMAELKALSPLPQW